MPSTTPTTAWAPPKAHPGTASRAGHASATASPNSSAPNSDGDGTPARFSARPTPAVAAASTSQGSARRTPSTLGPGGPGGPGRAPAAPDAGGGA